VGFLPVATDQRLRKHEALGAFQSRSGFSPRRDVYAPASRCA
jgi:hypothetical protein